MQCDLSAIAVGWPGHYCLNHIVLVVVSQAYLAMQLERFAVDCGKWSVCHTTAQGSVTLAQVEVRQASQARQLPHTKHIQI
jgi:hypothetical protein